MRGRPIGINYVCRSFAYEFVIAIMSDDAEQQKKTLMRELDAWPQNLTDFERAYNKIYGTGVYGTGIIFEQVFSELSPGLTRNLAFIIYKIR